MIPPQAIAAVAKVAPSFLSIKKKLTQGLVNSQKELSNHYNSLSTSNLATGYDASNDGKVGGGMFNFLNAFSEGMKGVKHEMPKFEGAPLKNAVEPPKPDTGVEVKDLQNNSSSIMNTLENFDSKVDFSSITAAAKSFKKGGFTKCSKC